MQGLQAKAEPQFSFAIQHNNPLKSCAMPSVQRHQVEINLSMLSSVVIAGMSAVFHWYLIKLLRIMLIA